jgi:hypothetical protein
MPMSSTATLPPECGLHQLRGARAQNACTISSTRRCRPVKVIRDQSSVYQMSVLWCIWSRLEDLMVPAMTLRWAQSSLWISRGLGNQSTIHLPWLGVTACLKAEPKRQMTSTRLPGVGLQVRKVAAEHHRVASRLVAAGTNIDLNKKSFT